MRPRISPNLMIWLGMCIFLVIYTHEAEMRTNIDIDDALLTEAMKATGLTTKKATVEEALKRVVKASRQRKALEDLRGIGWEGDLDEMRNDWTPDVDWGLQDKRS
jgi:Arc/MetJ family transcription regulator